MFFLTVAQKESMLIGIHLFLFGHSRQAGEHEKGIGEAHAAGISVKTAEESAPLTVCQFWMATPAQWERTASPIGI